MIFTEKTTKDKSVFVLGVEKGKMSASYRTKEASAFHSDYDIRLFRYNVMDRGSSWVAPISYDVVALVDRILKK